MPGAEAQVRGHIREIARARIYGITGRACKEIVTSQVVLAGCGRGASGWVGVVAGQTARRKSQNTSVIARRSRAGIAGQSVGRRLATAPVWRSGSGSDLSAEVNRWLAGVPSAVVVEVHEDLRSEERCC